MTEEEEAKLKKMVEELFWQATDKWWHPDKYPYATEKYCRDAFLEFKKFINEETARKREIILKIKKATEEL